jgi:mono/diheme cytochrome c family protein
VTEIPEHLLKRSKERRAALGLPGGEGGDAPAPAGDAPVPAESAPAETAPVAARAAAAPVPAAPPPPPPPPPPHVQAAQNRKRIPYWAMPVIVLLPLWAVIYYNAVKVPPVNDDVLTQGAAVYASGGCGGCHGPTGAGGTGPQLSGGEVLKTWPDPVGMMQWIHLGANAWTDDAAKADYGDPKRPGGPHNTAMHTATMPGFTDLSAADLAAVTRYVRETLSGAPDETDVVTEELAQTAIDDAGKGQLVYKNVKPDPARIKASTPSSG